MLKIPDWLTICIVNIPCGVALGLAFLRSDEERWKLLQTASTRPFGSDSFFMILVVGLVKALFGAALLVVPSGLLLRLLGVAPLQGNFNLIWVVSMLAGLGLGKLIRWVRWKKRTDFA
jgi:hypothetical protein